jgi:Ran-binding protein 3
MYAIYAFISIPFTHINSQSSAEVSDTAATDNPPRLSDLAAPTKKNKLEPASPTDSEGSGPNTPPRRSPPLPSTMTPKHESKVKQIRQQVRDMTWQDPLSQGSSISAEPTIILEEPQEDDNERPALVDGDVSSKSDKIYDIQEDDLEKGAFETPPPLTKIQDKVTLSGMQKDPNGESIKRPREDPDVDDNPRETKRPSPPPAKEPVKESPAASTSTATATAATVGILNEFFPLLIRITTEWFLIFCIHDLTVWSSQSRSFCMVSFSKQY